MPFETPGPDSWSERLEAVLTTLEVAYAKAHADAAGDGLYADFAVDVLQLTQSLSAMLPNEGEVLGLARLSVTPKLGVQPGSTLTAGWSRSPIKISRFGRAR